MPPFASFADLRAVCLDLPSGHPAASNASPCARTR